MLSEKTTEKYNVTKYTLYLSSQSLIRCYIILTYISYISTKFEEGLRYLSINLNPEKDK